MSEPSAPKPKPRRRRTTRASPSTPAVQPADAADSVQPVATAPDAAQPVVAAPPTQRSFEATGAPSESAARRRVWMSGGAGFVGRAVVQALVERGDDVVAAVRDPARASFLTELGATLVRDDLADVRRLTEAMTGIDAVVHAAGQYRVGITRAQRGAMWDANIGTTTRVLDAAEAARVPRIVYVSTVNVFGNTHGQVADEGYRRDLAEGFLSWYDETKYGAHEVAQQRAKAGAPIVTVMPSQAYGRADPSSLGEQLRLAFQGKLPYRAFDDMGIGLVHVDDLAAGIGAALGEGSVGESYVLSGPRVRFRQAIELAAAIGGRRPPRLVMPTRLLRLLTPAGRFIGQPNLAEVISAAAGVTYWATPAKAEAALGFRARSVEDGLRDTFGVASPATSPIET